MTQSAQSFRVHPGMRDALTDFAYLDLEHLAECPNDVEVVKFMQGQIRQILHGADPHDLWFAVKVRGREPQIEEAERDCQIANAILLEGYRPGLRTGDLDALKLKVEQDWNALRDIIGQDPYQPPEITQAIVHHAWRRCWTPVRKKYGEHVKPHAFRVIQSKDAAGRATFNFDAIFDEPDPVRRARHRWHSDPVLRRTFKSESVCAAYFLDVLDGRVKVNGSPVTIDQEMAHFMI